RNLIDGGRAFGLYITGATTSNNLVQGNYVGLNAAGTASLGNVYGILVSGATGTTIGGTTAAARNVISGNEVGVRFDSEDTSLFEGNYVGTDPTGTSAVPNGVGMSVYYGGIGGSHAVIGGLTPTPGTGAGNVISGNSSTGVALFGSSPPAFEGNIIGLNAAGT